LRRSLAALAVLVGLAPAGCSSDPEPKDSRPASPPAAPRAQDPPPPSKEKPAAAPATRPVETPRPAPAPVPESDPNGRAAARAWEKGRIALVVDLITRAKSFDRGFEAALLFIPDMREGVTAALVEQSSSRDGRASERSLEAIGAMAHLRLIPDTERRVVIDTVTKRVHTETAPGCWSAAVVALGSLAGHDAGQDVAEALVRSVDEDCAPVTRACADVLGDIQFHEAAPALVVALDRASDQYARRTLVRALGRLGGKDAAHKLIDALQGPDPADREVAASALGEAGGADAASALRSAIERPEETPTVRRAAIAALERMGGDDAVTALKNCLQDLSARHEEVWATTTRDISETLERVQRK
jgi:hypothetical protein